MWLFYCNIERRVDLIIIISIINLLIYMNNNYISKGFSTLMATESGLNSSPTLMDGFNSISFHLIYFLTVLQLLVKRKYSADITKQIK